MLSNQDKKEMLLMIAECATKGGYVSLEKELLKKAASLPQDEPERKMPEVDDQYIEVRLMYGVLSVHDGITWSGQDRQRYAFENGFAFRMDERELAEKKCAELNKILAS